jgi:tetratricopeptide (TPR) repeat protein
MRLSRNVLLGVAVLGLGCAARLPEPQPPTMVRNFHGTLVPGYYVSPAAYEHYMRAQLLSNDGRAEEAAEELRHALASDGASAYLRTRLAEELLSLGRVDEAREEVEAALHLDAQFAEAWVELGRVKLRVGDSAGAEAALHKALEIDRACEEAYVTLVGIYSERGLDARAEETWQRLARAVPGSAQAHEALGRAAAARDDEKTAESELQRALELDGNLQDARIALAQLYQGEGRYTEAAGHFADAYERSGDIKVAELLVRLQMSTRHEATARELVERLEDEGGSPERRLAVGWLHLIAKQPARARAIAEDVLKKIESGSARLLAGAALDEEGNVEAALAQLRRVPQGSSEFTVAAERMGRLLRDSGRYREAIDLLGRALASVGPAGAGVGDTLSDLLAQAHERAGNPSTGIRLLEAALARRPQSAALAFALGGAYQRAGDWEHAVEVVRRVVLRRDPDSPQALNFIGYALAERGVKLDEAERLLEHALALKPSSGEIADSLGWLLVKLGRLDRAERLLLRADRLAPEEPEILSHLGELYVKKADRARALEVYKRALGLRPEERLRRACEEQILLLETGRVGSR